MPAASTSRRRVSGKQPAPKPPIGEDNASTLSDSTKEEVLSEIAKLRRARSDYYNKSPQERAKAAKPMAQEKKIRKSKRDHIVHKARASTASVHHVGSRSQVSHHRRRRREKKKEEDDGDDEGYVYKQARAESKSSLAPGPKHRRSSIRPEKRSSTEPRNASTLDRLGLAPQRRTSTRSTKTTKTGAETLQRRHSYHGDMRRRDTITENDAEGAMDGAAQPGLRRSASSRETTQDESTRPVSRSNTTKTRRTRQSTPILPVVPEEPNASTPTRQRSTNVFGSLFGASKLPAPEVQVTCLTCMSDDIQISRSAKLSCGHRMCHPCLKRIFTLSVTDPAHMPPKCCTADCIPLKHVEKLFDTKFKSKWNRKYQEYTTKNRIYCPSRGCGAWIPPKDIKPDTRHAGRKVGKCARCKTRVCATCNNKWHSSKDCPNDEATNHFIEMAKEKGWQRCFNCRATVELKEGCNHMTCRCTAEFCMICGAKWKSCDCPWFNYATVETDRLQHMNIAQIRRVALDPAAAAALNAPRDYHEELERRRAQEQTDEQMARRMQGVDFDLFGGRNIPVRRRAAHADDPAAGGDDIFALGNAGRHFLNDNFVQRAQNILTAPYNQEQRVAADRLVAEIRGQQRTDGIGLPSPPAATQGRANRRGAQATAAATAGASVAGVVPGRGREAEVLVPRRNPGDYETQAARLRPMGSVRRSTTRAKGKATEGAGNASPASPATPATPTAEEDAEPATPKSSSSSRAAMLAGLTRRSTQGRVDAWRRHVEVGAEG